MSDFVKDFRPAEPRPRYDAAVAKLQAADSDVLIAHIDSGLAPHSVFGGGFPAHILIDQGRNFYDPGGANGHKPITDLSRGDDIAADLIEYPDHGVKTLSVILGEDDTKIHGVAPRTKIVPYRVSNGPLFRGSAGPRMDKPATARIGQAIDHALDLPTPPSVISISMGNPGHAGLFEFFRTLLGGSAGMAKETKQAINKAYERGVIIVCAAG
ncbi:MAG: S8/S53 family peptidase, partial [Pseudomonadota bacterium]